MDTPFDPDAQDVLLVGFGNSEERAREDLSLQLTQVLVHRYDTADTIISTESAHIIEEAARERSLTLDPEEQYSEPVLLSSPEQYFLFRYTRELIAADLDRIARAVPGEYTEMPLQFEEGREGPPLQSTLRRLEALLTQPIPEDEAEQMVVLEQALALASSLSVATAPGEVSLALGASRGGEIRVRLRDETARAEVSPEPMAAIVTLPDIDGTREVLRIPVAYDSDGRYRLELLEIPVAGLSRLEVGPVWFFPARARWQAAVAPGGAQELLRAIAARLAPEVAIQVSSRARSIPTAIILVDMDIAGNPIANRDATRGAHQQFTGMGFLVHQPEIAPAVQLELIRRGTLDVADLYDLLPFEVLAGVERVIVGTAGISEFTEEDGFSVRVVLEAAAFDLRRDNRLAEIRLEERVSGADSRTILRTAFLSAGRRAARRIAPRLP